MTPDEPFADLSDADLDEVLTGAAPGDTCPWALGELVTDVRDACATPDEAPPAGLVAVLAATAAAAAGPAAPDRRRRRLRPVAAWVSTCAAAVSLTTGLAAADELPGPAQDVVARVAEAVGLELPGGSAPEQPRASEPGERGSARRRAQRAPQATDTPAGDAAGRGANPPAGRAPGASGRPPGTPPEARAPGGAPPAATPTTGTPPSTQPADPPGQDHRPPGPPGQEPGGGRPEGEPGDVGKPGVGSPATTRPERPSGSRSDKSPR